MEFIDAFVESNAREARRQHKRKVEEITECDESLAYHARKIRKIESPRKWSCQHQREADKVTKCKACLEIYQRKIKKLENSKRYLEKKSAQFRLVSRLKKKDGAEAWEKLSTRDDNKKWKKVNVLTVLRCCQGELPRELKEANWIHGHVYSAGLSEDRDILLARLARKDFSAHYVSSMDPETIRSSVFLDDSIATRKLPSPP